MPLEDVIGEILERSEREAQTILEQAREEAAGILKESETAANRRYEEYSAETDKLVEERKRTATSKTNQAINKMTLQAKREIIDGLFSRLVDRISNMDLAERRKVTERLMARALRELPDASYVYTSSVDEAFLKGRLKFGGAIETIGGIILENASRDIRVNYTFERFLVDLRDKYLNEVAGEIF